MVGFRDPGGKQRKLGDAPALAFAARATASFPGAFPPFQPTELDAVLKDNDKEWPGRNAFLRAVLPHRDTAEALDETVLIDGSVLANAPFGPAIDALASRPARREVDRRFLYIDPTPGTQALRFGRGGEEAPGFFATLLGAMSDIPREQPIHDALESLERRSDRVTRLSAIVAAMQGEVEAAIGRVFGRTLFLDRPTPARLSAWRSRAQNMAAVEAGYGYAAYVHLKLATVLDEAAAAMVTLSGGRASLPDVRRALDAYAGDIGLLAGDAFAKGKVRDDVIAFLRRYDLSFRVRRLRFLAREIQRLEEQGAAPAETLEPLRSAVHALAGRYRAPVESPPTSGHGAFASAAEHPFPALELLADRLDLVGQDVAADQELAPLIAALPRDVRKRIILLYLGFPFYDVASLPLLQGEGLDEFEPIKVDRISPLDATAIRRGGAEATLKGIAFNKFGAFFSRAYRENDYLWGRLHGADRLIDIVLSSLPPGKRIPLGRIAALKRDAFLAILAEEQPRLTRIAPLIDSLTKEISRKA